MDVTLVLSIRNEISRTSKKNEFQDLVRLWAKTAEKANGSLLIADAGSRDGTLDILKQLELTEPGVRILSSRSTNRSRVVRYAYEQLVRGSFGGYVCHIDASLRLPPELFLKIWELRLKAPFLIGRRIKRLDAYHEVLLSRFQWILCKLLFWRTSGDPNVGLRIYQTSFLKPLLEMIPRWISAVDLALCLYSFKSGVKILEIPIALKDRPPYQPLGFNHFSTALRRTMEIISLRLALPTVMHRLRLLRTRF